MHHTYVLISHVCQLCIPIPFLWSSHLPYAIEWSTVRPPITLYCKCFGLTVGEDVHDLRLPSVSRIPDIHIMVWILCHLLSLVYSDITCIYFIVSLLYVLWLASLQLRIALHHPCSPPCVFLFIVSALYYLVILNSEVLAHAGAV